MTKRRAAVLAAFCLALVAATVWWSLHGRPQITHENYARIQPGMTEAEVTAIIGAPPGNYGGRDHRKYQSSGGEGRICSIFFSAWPYWEPKRVEDVQKELKEGRIVLWTGPEHAIAVQLDGADRVVATGFGRVGGEPTWWEALRERLGL